MMNPGIARPLCVFLVLLITAPSGFAQPPATPVVQPPTQTPAPNQAPSPTQPPVSTPAPTPAPALRPARAEAPAATVSIVVLEGNNVVNSLPRLRSNAPVVEVQDENEFPVEGAVVVFTLPEQGPGGTFPGGASTFTTRSDAHGQAAAPVFTPRVAGKFQIKVTADAGIRKGDGVITQTNSTGDYSGPFIPSKPFYKKKLPLFLIAAAVVATVVVVVLVTGGSNSSTVTTPKTTITVTPGSPVFQ